MLKKIIKEIAAIFWPAALIGAGLFCIFSCVIRPVVISGKSMEPNYHDGDLRFIKMYDKKYERKDVVVVNSTEVGDIIIKRVIGVPGDTVQIKGSEVYVNDKKVKDVTPVKTKTAGLLKKPITLKSGEYIILGDNRQESLDSREIGPVLEEEIIGKIF